MKIGTDTEYIRLKEMERIPEGVPCAGDINLEVHLVLQDFRGAYSGIWLEVPVMEKFLQDLSVLEKSKRGKAIITSMSPEEFVLEIRSSDNLGHLEIEVQLHRYQYSGPKYWPIFLKGGFEAQPETVIKLISCFKNFTT